MFGSYNRDLREGDSRVGTRDVSQPVELTSCCKLPGCYISDEKSKVRRSSCILLSARVELEETIMCLWDTIPS